MCASLWIYQKTVTIASNYRFITCYCIVANQSHQFKYVVEMGRPYFGNNCTRWIGVLYSWKRGTAVIFTIGSNNRILFLSKILEKSRWFALFVCSLCSAYFSNIVGCWIIAFISICKIFYTNIYWIMDLIKNRDLIKISVAVFVIIIAVHVIFPNIHVVHFGVFFRLGFMAY